MTETEKVASVARMNKVVPSVLASALTNCLPPSYVKQGSMYDPLTEIPSWLASVVIKSGTLGGMAFAINHRMKGRHFTEEVPEGNVKAAADVLVRGQQIDRGLLRFAQSLSEAVTKCAAENNTDVVGLLLSEAVKYLPVEQLKTAHAAIAADVLLVGKLNNADSVVLDGQSHSIQTKSAAVDILKDAAAGVAVGGEEAVITILARHPEIRRELNIEMFEKAGSAALFNNDKQVLGISICGLALEGVCGDKARDIVLSHLSK